MRRRSREVLVRCPVAICNYLINQKREHIAQIEARYGLSVRIEGDPSLISPDFSIEKFKTATRVVPEPSAHVVSVDTSLMDQIDEDTSNSVDEDEAPAPVGAEVTAPENTPNDEDGKPKKRRRRRRRRGKSNGNGEGQENGNEGENGAAASNEDAANGEATPVAAEQAADEEDPQQVYMLFQ